MSDITLKFHTFVMFVGARSPTHSLHVTCRHVNELFPYQISQSCSLLKPTRQSFRTVGMLLFHIPQKLPEQKLHIFFWGSIYMPSGPYINPLNAGLNPIGHLLALLEAHHILHGSRMRVKWHSHLWSLGARHVVTDLQILKIEVWVATNGITFTPSFEKISGSKSYSTDTTLRGELIAFVPFRKGKLSKNASGVRF